MGDNSWMMKPFPTGWEQKYDPRINRYYFVNHQTRNTQWDDPRKEFYAVNTAQQQFGAPQTSQAPAPPQLTKKERLVAAFKNNLTSEMAETWDDAEIDTFIGELLETSGNDFNLVMKEIDKLKTDMATKDESEVEEEEDDPFDPEELKRIQEEAKLEAAQRKRQEEEIRVLEAEMERQAELDRKKEIERVRKEREERDRKRKAEAEEKKRLAAEQMKRLEEETRLGDMDGMRRQMDLDAQKMALTLGGKKTVKVNALSQGPRVKDQGARPREPKTQTPRPVRTRQARAPRQRNAPLKFEHATVAVGRNPMLALGAHGSMASGANRALRSGPNKDLLVGSSGARGPDPSLRIMRN